MRGGAGGRRCVTVLAAMAEFAYTWNGAAERLKPMAKGIERADEEWLRSLTLEESIRILEDLCQGIPEVELRPDRDPPPVVRFRTWRS